MKITGIHHIKLTVTNLERSKDFYSKFPDFKIVAEYDDFIMFFTGGFYLGLTTSNQKENNKFSELTTGLDHLAFSVESMNDLEEALEFFDENNIEHSEIKKLSNNTHIVTFRDPDNIQLELAYKE